ncbi:MAG TPA: LLM class flavin-dependent oxidoreductase [Pseudonocardiaceae bacterium]|nr:LLM class flavin-dependent oxidoreductase [Pseudonocardiaceae bacterium]
MNDIPLSVLDLPMTQAGRPTSEILSGMADVARRVEELGYRRVWYAEHHATTVMADFPPPIVIAHIAAVTSTIRVGSGGVMAPNHAPLSVAEQFGALAALHPGRVDLGVGRGPGTRDESAIRALRRGADQATEAEYAVDVADLLHRVGERADAPEPWLLASSTTGAKLAAQHGLPVAFAHHIRPANTAEAAEAYRAHFRPSRWSAAPRIMVSLMAFCANTDAEADRLARPYEVFSSGIAVGEERAMPSPDEAAAYEFTQPELDAIAGRKAGQVRGTPTAVARRLAELAAEFGADELMLATPVYDPAERIASFELVSKSW